MTLKELRTQDIREATWRRAYVPALKNYGQVKRERDILRRELRKVKAARARG